MFTVPVPLAHTTGQVSAAAAVGLAVLALVAHRGRQEDRATTDLGLLAIVYGAMAFQVVHALEHVLQIGYWIQHPTQPPWLTPWAEVGRDALALATDGQTGTGNELLHLGGNLIFLAGLVAAVVVARRWSVPAERTRWLRLALWLQAAHVAEHLVLTTTAIAWGAGHGASTAFGLLTPGTVLAAAVRVWLHLLLNLAATAFAVAGILQLRSVCKVGESPERLPVSSR
jgi:hypothetical protein